MKMNFPVALISLTGVVALTYYSFTIESNEPSIAQSRQATQLLTDKPTLAVNHTAVPTKRSSELFQHASAKQLWQPVPPQQHPKDIPDNLNVEYIKANQPGTMNLSEGQQVAILIPQENKSFIGVVDESTRAYGGEITISSGTIENGDENSSFSITEGKNTTFITVATGESIYQVEINKQTGIGVVLDDRELNQYRQNEDGILPPPEGIS
jgi:hypothetical protein